MAHMYPQKGNLVDTPYSEVCVYDLLSELGDNFYIFHSVQWIKRGSKWKSTWKENDFLILNKNLGALVLEVKGGDIEYRDGVFNQINHDTKEISVLDPKKKNDPLSQAIDGIYHYRKVLDNIISDLSDRFPIEAAVWFSSSDIATKKDKFPLGYREVPGAILGAEAFKKGTQAIYDVFDFYDNHNKTQISDEEFSKIIEAIASDFDLITAPSAKKGELEHAFLKMTNEQMGLLDYISEQNVATIQGVAGTGKTLIAKEAARRFASEGRKVLFLCFNKFLFVDLQKRFPYDNVTYYNIHSFIVKYGPGNDLSTVDMRATALEKIDWDELDFDDVIIDEAQDFDNREIMYFKQYCELRDGHFFVFYDKNQLLTTKEVPEWILKSECKLVLMRNCRNTLEVARTSYNVIDIDFKTKTEMVSGGKTMISFVKGQSIPILGRLLIMLTGDKYGYEYSDIVILSLTTEDSSIMKDVNKISGIPISNERNNSSVLFTTSKKFKGLESKVVIIVDITEDCFVREEKKRNFYVACSRATQQLALFVNADEKQIKEMANVVGGNEIFNDKHKIAIKTKAKIVEF